jgi:hypothetical protein
VPPVYQYGSNEYTLNPPSKWSVNAFKHTVCCSHLLSNRFLKNGLSHEMNIFLKAHKIQFVLIVKKIKLNVLVFSLKTLTNFKILTWKPLQRAYCGLASTPMTASQSLGSTE